jgi:phosphohistidine phosphatase
MHLEELVPELIISSTARRARTTAEAVIGEFDNDVDLQVTRALYLADAEEYLDILRDQDNDIQCMMVVGHNPGMEDLVEHLTGARERMPTAALAHVRLPIESWRSLKEEVEGELVNVWRPKELPP